MDKWWKNAIGYQIYIKSFCDSNNDGIGDLKGITSKLDYLKDLGINFIWICPFYDSPMDDNGYDIRNYYQVDKTYGTLEDLKILINTAHKKNIKVIIDLILNHTSTENEWFLKSKQKIEPYSDFYIWKDGKNQSPPNNWQSFFSGAAWHYDETRKQYFLSLFSKKMADLNFENQKVIDELEKLINFYSQLNIDGFRLDAISHIGKDLTFNNSKTKNKSYKHFSNLEPAHKYLKNLNKIFTKNNLATFGELGGSPNVKEICKFFDNEIDSCFSFEQQYCINSKNHLLNLNKFKKILKFKNAIANNNGWPALFWFNHDYPRLVSMISSSTDSKNESICMAVLMYFLRGTPIIYNGEEIGMTNYPFSSSDDFNDVRSKMIVENLKNKNKTFLLVKETSRDNSRTIMQWNDSKYAGFSNYKPWFFVNDNYTKINVEFEQTDKNSFLNIYKNFLKIRSCLSNIIENSEYKIFKKGKRIGYYINNKDNPLLIEANFSNKEIRLPVGEILFSNKTVTNKLKSFEVVIIKLPKTIEKNN